MKTRKNINKLRKFDKGIILVHDELLVSLYNTLADNPEEVSIRKVQYLKAKSNCNTCTLELIAKIPSNLLMYNGKIQDYCECFMQQQENILKELKDKLCFSSHEIYILNILIDNYIRNGRKDITLSEIHKLYREKTFQKNHTIDVVTSYCYVKAFLDLAEKNIYCKTAIDFRNQNYGSHDRMFFEPLITITKFVPMLNERDAYIEYEFGEFINILKKSKRYSSMIPAEIFSYAFRSNIQYMIAINLARTLFIKRLDRASWIPLNPITIKATSLLQMPAFNKKGQNENITILDKVYSCKYKAKVAWIKRLIKYIETVLEMFKKYEIINDFNIETEKTYMGVHEFEKLEIKIYLRM